MRVSSLRQRESFAVAMPASIKLTMTHRKQALPARFAHPQPLPSLENDRPFALPFAEDLTHLLYVNNGGAMDADKFPRIKCTRIVP